MTRGEAIEYVRNNIEHLRTDRGLAEAWIENAVLRPSIANDPLMTLSPLGVTWGDIAECKTQEKLVEFLETNLAILNISE